MKELNITNFQSEVKEGNVIVDFWAPWCGPCRMQGPILEELENERDDIKVCKVNVDNEIALAQMFSVQSIPTLVLFKDGKPINKVVGLHSKEDLEDLFD